jgi:hypothetical protein
LLQTLECLPLDSSVCTRAELSDQARVDLEIEAPGGAFNLLAEPTTRIDPVRREKEHED